MPSSIPLLERYADISARSQRSPCRLLVMESVALTWTDSHVSALDLEQEQWTQLATTPPAKAPESACYIYSTEGLYIAGGFTDSGTSARVYKYDSDRLTAVTPMLQGRTESCGVAVGKSIFVFGGYNRESEVTFACCEQMSVESNRWTPLPWMKRERRAAAACVLGDMVFVLGGVGVSEAEVLSLPDLKWTEADFALPVPLSNPAVFVLTSHCLMVLGGRLDDNSLTQNVLRIDLDTDVVTEDVSLAKPFAVSQPCSAYGGKLFLVSEQDFVVYHLSFTQRRSQRHSTDPGKTQIRMDLPGNLSRELASRGIMGLENADCGVSIALPERPLVFVVKRPGKADDIDIAFLSIISELLSLRVRVIVEVSSLPLVPAEVSAFDLKVHSGKVNLLVTLGGDGTVIWAVGLFKTEPIPCVLAVHMGSLGFMTYYSVVEALEILRLAVAQAEMKVDLKKRLDIWCTLANGKKSHKGTALNEVVIDRGESASLLHVDCYMNGEFFTTAFADGVMIATPAGSTAYSLAAGGSIVHHEIPCTLFTPICPHSLSFRPILFPEKVELSFVVPDEARCSGNVSIDGIVRFELPKKTTLEVVTSCYPVPFISHSRGLSHWMKQLKSTMKWNKRKKQKPLDHPPKSVVLE